MAKEKGATYSYPSRFGSHTSMIDQDETTKLGDAALVACRDEFGVYVTEKARLDTGLADPKRYVETRLTKLFVSKEKKKAE